MIYDPIKVKDKYDVLKAADLLAKIGIKVFPNDKIRQAFTDGAVMSNGILKAIPGTKDWTVEADTKLRWAISLEELQFQVEKRMKEEIVVAADMIVSNRCNHVMLDLETLGTESDSVILSIGLVEFNINTGETGSSYKCNVDIQSCLDIGLKVKGDTVRWWMSQSNRDVFKDTGTDIRSALSGVNAWITRDMYIWANSPRFDCGILQTAFNKIGMDIPWNYQKERCVRTLAALHPTYKLAKPSHDAIQDCKDQIKLVCDIYKDNYISKTAAAAYYITGSSHVGASGWVIDEPKATSTGSFAPTASFKDFVEDITARPWLGAGFIDWLETIENKNK